MRNLREFLGKKHDVRERPRRIDFPSLPSGIIIIDKTPDGTNIYGHEDRLLQEKREKAIQASARLKQQDTDIFRALGKLDHVHFGLLGETPTVGQYNNLVSIDPTSVQQIVNLQNTEGVVLGCADSRVQQDLIDLAEENKNKRRKKNKNAVFIVLAGGAVQPGEPEGDLVHMNTHLTTALREQDMYDVLDYVVAVAGKNLRSVDITGHSAGCALVSHIFGMSINEAAHSEHQEEVVALQLQIEAQHAKKIIKEDPTMAEAALMKDAIVAHPQTWLKQLPIGVTGFIHIIHPRKKDKDRIEDITNISSTGKRIGEIPTQ
jgi:hypothetical protein